MASHGCREFYISPGSGGIHPSEIGSICVSSTKTTVTCSVVLQEFSSTATPYKYYWKMSLQRYDKGKWNTIGTRTGYVSRNSPSHRDFTNVLRPGKRTRVWVYFESPINSGGASEEWVR